MAFTGFFYRDFSRRSGVISLVGVGTAFAFILLLLMGSGVDERFGTIGFGAGGRYDVYRSTLRLIADHPWFGTGLGTFVWSFPAYRSANISVSGVWDRAHNTLLELTAEMGVPLAALITLAWLIALIVLARGIVIRRRDNVLPTAAFAVACLALLHSFVEFSLQTPGCAVMVFALVGAGISQSFRDAPRPGLSTDTAGDRLYVASIQRAKQRVTAQQDSDVA
jgi:O-antigen ligase